MSEITSRLMSQTNMNPMTPASMETMVKMTQNDAKGLGINMMATNNMIPVPAIKQLMVDGYTPMN